MVESAVRAFRYVAIYGNGNDVTNTNTVSELDFFDEDGNHIDYPTPSIVDGASCTNPGSINNNSVTTAACYFGNNRARLVLDLGRLINDADSVRLTMFFTHLVTSTLNDISLWGDVVSSRFADAANPRRNTVLPLISERDIETSSRAPGPVVKIPDVTLSSVFAVRLNAMPYADVSVDGCHSARRVHYRHWAC